ncbi:hypothetical protein ACNI4X_29265, partial [Klebsiella pneumoniae]|uniref:hypothetical protein n=1 Tax=Klebsiella pneumoniae TaxID=573 RepID=UPI003A88F497
ESLEFGGVYGLNIDGLDTTKIDQDVTEATGDGGSVGRRRLPTREVKVECLLMAATSRGLEWGLRWLTRSLLADGCGGDSGPRDLVFLESCPDYRQWERPADVRERAGQLTRMLTSVVVTKTPEVTNRYGVSNDRGDYAPCMAVVEFELTALVPRVWRSPVVLLGPR